jgi:hypothetical protein
MSLPSERRGIRYLLHTGFSLGLFLDPEHGDDMFFRKVG